MLTSTRQVSGDVQRGGDIGWGTQEGAAAAIVRSGRAVRMVLTSVHQVSGDVQRGGDVPLGRNAGEVAGHGAAEALAVVLGRLDGGRLAAVLPQPHRLDPPLQRLVPCVLQAQ